LDLLTEIYKILPNEDPDELTALTGDDVITSISKTLRSFLIASPSHRLIIGDFGQIEARVVAWLAGQDDLVEAFASGRDLYIETAATLLEKEEADVTRYERALAKCIVLGCGFGMSAMTFRTTAAAWGAGDISLKLATQSVNHFRQTYSNIAGYWRLLNQSALDCIRTGETQKIGRIGMFLEDGYFKIRLPIKRTICYPDPQVDRVIAPWSRGYSGRIKAEPQDIERLTELGATLGDYEDGWFTSCQIPDRAYKKVLAYFRCELEKKELQRIDQISFMGLESQTNSWKRIHTAGHKLTENVVQATARDIMADAMIRAEAEGYPIVFTVHDEIVADVPETHGSLDHFVETMAEVPFWAKGCPIAVDAFESDRYRKEAPSA
jgi:DNA polymerase